MPDSATLVSQAAPPGTTNLTSKGDTDFWTVNSSQTILRKTGGGAIIDVNPFTFDSFSGGTWDNGYTLTSFTDSNTTSSLHTTTDATPSDVTNSDAGIYYVDYQGAGLEYSIDVGVGVRRVELGAGWNVFDANKLTIGLRVISPSAGILLDTDLGALAAIYTNYEKVITLDLEADSNETWKILTFASLTEQYGDNVYHGVKWVWAGPVVGGGGGSDSIGLMKNRDPLIGGGVLIS